ncbi:MAG: cyclic nucleotide-binding domain-containing protein [Ignavibacteriaceae bacterium]
MNTGNAEFLSSVPIFSELSPETIEKVSKLATVRLYPKNTIILGEEEAGSAFFVIVSGKVKVSRISNDDSGKEVILSILNPLDFFDYPESRFP